MLKKKIVSLNIEIWKYFLIFSVLILGFLWVFQVLFLDTYYKSERTRTIKHVSKIINKEQKSKDFSKIINELAFDNEICVEIIDKNFLSLYSTTYFGKGCISGKERTYNYIFDFINSNQNEKTYELINPAFNNDTLVNAIKLNNDRYAFINASLDPIDSTSKIIRKQLIIITIVILLLSFIISYFISNYISDPIVKINKAAKKLAKGQFDVIFENDSKILELNELTNTLNYTKDELSKTEELRRDLMANVSHDLKTPLTMIKAYAEMSRDLHADNKEKREENMNIIIKEIDRLTILVNDILSLSSMQSNIDKLNESEFDLINLINDILKKYTILQETENYHFNFTHKDEKILINADKKKLEQVIYNLVNNAINYTGDDNTVTITVTVITNNSIKVEITDTGKGIKEEEIPYIWDKYYKNKKKHKRNLVGTGLGLSIVKNALEQHNYQYGVNSIKNQGTTFYFIIPNEKEKLNKENKKM